LQFIKKHNTMTKETQITNANTSIFYVNSMGFMSQWKGKVIAKDETSISIRFSKNKALKFNLKDLDIDFCLVTNKHIKNLGVSILDNSTATQFDEKLKQIVLENTIGNVKALWSNGKWEA